MNIQQQSGVHADSMGILLLTPPEALQAWNEVALLHMRMSPHFVMVKTTKDTSSPL